MPGGVYSSRRSPQVPEAHAPCLPAGGHTDFYQLSPFRTRGVAAWAALLRPHGFSQL